MRVVTIHDEAGFLGLRTEWESLLAHSASNTIFLTWEWLSAWWQAYGKAGELNILLALDYENVLRGIAPLRRSTLSVYGRSFRALSFIGDGSCDSDYLDFIIGAGDEAAAMNAFFRHLDEDLSRGALLHLNEVPEDSPSLNFLQELGGRDGMLWRESDVACATVPLPEDWREYLKGLAPRFRTKIRSVLRNLEGRAEAHFQVCQEEEALQRLLPSLYELHTRRWAKEAKPGVFHWDRKRAFYEALSPLLLERGRLFFSWLEWKGQILACQYGFTHDHRYFHLQEGYEPACEHWNAGIALRAWSIRQLVQNGIREYDFLGGVSRHKSDWGARTKLSKHLTIARAQAAGALYLRGREWASRARQSLKAMAPGRLLAARDARQERQRVAAFRGGDTAAADRFRTALASCYYYSPLPSVLPFLRDRYRLRISPNGALPHVRLESRREPSARILYFHRVDDRADPYTGAISVEVFERQMKFLARRHRVVSLAEAARRLRERSPLEPVVAITFDDGYQDNYLKAFPVLKRYGLPATIFLTTGNIDSRERPWFERLGLALKRTTQPFIDFEIDIPRRLWMRTTEERLKSKSEVNAALRSLPDEERRRALANILDRLDVPADSEDTMLTWDQIRNMKRDGIDFGGHTVTHPFVSRLLPEQAVWEVSECKRRIEAELQSPVEYFAYPNGREGDFESWNKRVLEEAGYTAAVSTLWGVNYPSTDRMELRRGQPWEESAAVFAAKLDWYQWGDI